MAGYIATNEGYSSSIPQLFAGDGDVLTRPGVFATGQVLMANTVIARNTTSGELVQWAPAGANGTNIAIGITCEAVNTTSPAGAASHPYYYAGDFNVDALVWPGGATATQKELAFDRSPISVRALGG